MRLRAHLHTRYARGKSKEERAKSKEKRGKMKEGRGENGVY